MKTLISVMAVALLGVGIGLMVMSLLKKGTATQVKEEVQSQIFSPETFEQALMADKDVLMVIGDSKCSVCRAFVQELQHKIERFPLTMYYLDTGHHYNNAMLTPTLNVVGYPNIYVLNRQGNIVYVINNPSQTEEKLDSIYVKKLPIELPYLLKYGEKVSVEVLDNSFHALLADMRADGDNRYKYARASFDERPYCFNSYMLHKYFEEEGQSDSAEVYRAEALGYISTQRDFLINIELLRLLDPSDSRLERYDSLSRVLQ